MDKKELEDLQDIKEEMSEIKKALSIDRDEVALLVMIYQTLDSIRFQTSD